MILFFCLSVIGSSAVEVVVGLVVEVAEPLVVVEAESAVPVPVLLKAEEMPSMILDETPIAFASIIDVLSSRIRTSIGTKSLTIDEGVLLRRR